MKILLLAYGEFSLEKNINISFFWQFCACLSY